jgi:hypothetical protein
MTEDFEVGSRNAECGKRGDRRERYLNSELGMRKAERKTEDIGQSFEFGIGNAEGGKKDGGQKTDGR